MMFLRCACGELIEVDLADDAEEGDLVHVFVGDHLDHLGNGEIFEVMESMGGDQSIN